MQNKSEQLVIAEQIREACIKAAREGFMDASMSGLCMEGALEAAISAMQSLNIDQILKVQADA
ncbi:MAG: acetyltransferase [Balneola sp.]|nr:acetyltransferase [Balneola sp.]|tara:strand:- start:101146 stop:101334 length:189 start_codon:yes stop_codon:yes gene_type:complete